MIKHGKISFKTCFHQVYIPASYVIMLAKEKIHTPGDTKIFTAAFDMWLLCELLGAIGGHSGD